MRRRTGFAKLGYDNRVRSNPSGHPKAGPVTVRFVEPNPLSDEERAERECRWKKAAILWHAHQQRDSPFNPEAENN